MNLINKEGLETLIRREKQLRNDSPEHTLDWYTYNNRVFLLNEVLCLVTEAVVTHAPTVKKTASKKELQSSNESKDGGSEADTDSAVAKATKPSKSK